MTAGHHWECLEATFNPKVAGSIPARPISEIAHLESDRGQAASVKVVYEATR
jgi:hypothetical protein